MQNPVEHEDRKWSRVSLRIVSDVIDPVGIGKKLGLEPTKTHVKGSLRSTRHSATWPSSLWLLNSPLSDQSDMADHIRYFLDLLAARVHALEALTANCKIDLFCGFSSGNGQGGFALDPHTLSRLAALKIPVVFDLYPPSIAAEELAADGA
jgi:hypothetical protein